MKFAKLSEYLEKLEKTASRNEITEILSEVFRKASAEEIDKICYLLLGRVAPHHEGIEFNLAERMMVRAVAMAYGVDANEATRRYKKAGDLGDVAYELSKSKVKSQQINSKNWKSKLTVTHVYEKLMKVATEEGKGSQERKIKGMADLLKSLDSLSGRYVARIPVGKLRLGFSDITMLDALSLMEVGDKSARKQIEAAYNVTADIGKIAKRVKVVGVGHDRPVEAEPGVPIRTSLAERLPTAEKIIEKVGPKVAIEPKFDGFRTQLHVLKEGKGKKVIIFSRNHENVTDMFPDVVRAAKRLPVKDAILDGEAIGYNPKTEEFIDFQQTMQRKRKYGIKEMTERFPLKVFLFDMLYLNGKTVMEEPFSKRRKRLEKLMKDHEDTLMLTEQTIVNSPEELIKLFDEYYQEGLEGLMAKKIDVAYQAGGRGFHWVKYKKTTETTRGLADTIDCLVMGAYRGRGKRAEFGVGGFLLGVVDKGQFHALSRLGTGLSDEQFKEMHQRVKKLEVNKMPKEYVVSKDVEPDIWVKPVLVVEVLAEEITRSPRYMAGRDKTGRGFSLRFPRLVKFRDDKDPEQATSVSEIEKLFKMQKKKK